MYSSLVVWIAIVVGGVAGCLGLWAVLSVLAKVPFKALGGNPGKQLWSVLFMIPVPAILMICASAGLPFAIGVLVALAWLAVAPSAATILYFGPKTAKWGKTIGFNAIYGVIALIVYFSILSSW